MIECVVVLVVASVVVAVVVGGGVVAGVVAGGVGCRWRLWRWLRCGCWWCGCCVLFSFVEFAGV